MVLALDYFFVFREPAKPAKRKDSVMSRPKGSRSKKTLIREAEEREDARLLAEYKATKAKEAEAANKLAESPPAAPPPAKEVAATIAEHEELDLGELVPAAAAIAESSSGEIESVGVVAGLSDDSATIDDDPLDLEPPVNPKKKPKPPPFPIPEVKAKRVTVDKPAVTRKSAPVVKPREHRQPAPVTHQRPLGGVFAR